MRTLWLICLALLACACTPHAERCDGRLERINVVAPDAGAAPARYAAPTSHADRDPAAR